MKKRIALLTLLVLSFVFVFLLCSCQGDDETKITVIDRDEKYGYCEHSWEARGQTLPTCTDEGATFMKCSRCGERKTVKIPKVKCEHVEKIWQWYNNNTSVALILVCKYNPTHKRTVAGHISRISGEVIESPTCQKEGTRIFRANAVYNGKTYITEKTEALSRAPHSYEVVKTQLGSYCFAGTKAVEKCTVCGIEKTYAQKIEYNHTDVAVRARYELSSYGYCGGYIEINGCECGETVYLDIKPSCQELREVCEVVLEREENGENHVRTSATCTACSLCIVTEVGTIDGGSSELYSKTTVALDESTKISHCDVNRAAHEALAPYHETVITYEGLKESCTDGYLVVFSCVKCPYEKKLYTRGHYLTAEEAAFNFNDSCRISVEAERCHCGYIEDIKLTDVGCKVTEIPPSEHFGEDEKTFLPNAKAYKCTECGVSYFIGAVIKATELEQSDIAVIYEICSIKKDGEIIFEVESSNISYIEP